MIESQRRAYLDSMGFDIWVRRSARPERDRLLISPGQGSTLLICESPAASVTKLAGDVARALGDDPVWAWPDPDGTQDSERLQDAVGHRLFTRVIVFGESLAKQLFDGEIPAVLGSAAVHLISGLDDLAVRGTAKLDFWQRVRGWNTPDRPGGPR